MLHRLVKYPAQLLVNCIFTLTIAFLLSIAVIPSTAISAETGQNIADAQPRWWRGNMHSHTFWSDGDDFPENVAKWYKDNGFHFLVHTDHNVLLDGERWVNMNVNHPALKQYLENFGEDWVERKPVEQEGHVMVRLKPLIDFKPLFDEPDKFLLIMGEEITDALHFLAFNLNEYIPPAGGKHEDRSSFIVNTVGKVADYRQRTGRNTFTVLAHPNWTWYATAEMMAAVKELRFFEVYNGHPAVANDGDGFRKSTDRMWDIALALRLKENREDILYGIAVDDSHNYRTPGATPGRGWVVVRSQWLTPRLLLDAMEKGDFYASTGIVLRDIRREGNTIHVEIEPLEGVTFTTEFVGTKQGFDSTAKPTLDANGNEIPNTTMTYSKDIGEVLKKSDELSSSYTFTGDELYVRVRTTSTADQICPVSKQVIGKQRAWGQPMLPQ